MSSKRRRVVPGYTSQRGYYGRFAGSGAEKKFWDVVHSYTIDTTTEIPATGQLSLVPQGNTESSCVGRKYTVESIQGKWQLRLTPAASATVGGVYAIYLIQDTQCNGAAATAADVFTNGASCVEGMRNLTNSMRFKILKKWSGVLSPAAGVSGNYNHAYRYIDFYKKCKIPIEFSGTGGALADNRSNNLFIMAGTGSGGTFDDLVTVTGVTRLRFSDRG